MKIRLLLILFIALPMVSLDALAGDTTCFGYNAPGNAFFCTTHGNCTWWAAYKRPDIRGVFGGNAGASFYENARLSGFNTGQDPRDGAIVVFSSPAHVAYVEKTNSDKSFNASEMDYYGSLGTHNGVQNAVYHPYSGNRYTREDAVTGMGGAGGWTLLGFIYDRLFVPKVGQHLCARGKGVYGICWDIATLANISCQGGKNWEAYPVDWELESAYAVSNNRYCPDNGGIGGGGSGPEDHTAPPPITGSKHPGDLPDLIVNDHFLVRNDGDKNALTQIHVGERSNCAIQVKNVGQAGAWDDFQTRCYLSKGKWQDRNPPSPGHATIHGSVGLRVGQSRFVYIEMGAFDYPGSFNITACTNTDGGVKKESDDGNNCQEEYDFEVVSSPNLTTTAISLTGISGNPALNQPFSISSTTFSQGENFGQDYAFIGYFIDGALVGQNQIPRESLKQGMSQTGSIPVPAGITAPGVHTIKACANFTGDIVETTTADDCMSLLVTVANPKPPILSVTKVTFINGSHVYTTEKKDISIEVKNSGGTASLPTTGRMFFTPVAGGQDTAIGTFPIQAIPAAGTTTSFIPEVLFSGSGEMTTTVCLDSIPKCWNGGNIYVDTTQVSEDEEEDGTSLLIMYQAIKRL